MNSVSQNKPVSRSRRRLLGLSAVSLMLVTLGGCTTPFKADVKRFQAQLPAPTGQTFAVVADDPKDAGGLEFAQYEIGRASCRERV